MAKKLHPALKQRAAAVKAAHADCCHTIPGFTQKPGAEQIRIAQREASRRLGRGK